MKNIIFFTCLLFSVKAFGQQFSQYNSGTLYDSFENPSQRSFIPDSSRQYASNFFFPNANANIFLSGDAQGSLKGRAFLSQYNNAALLINQNRVNIVNASANIYLFMFKMYTNLKGDQEMGFSAQIRAEGKSTFTDEFAALLDGSQSFNNNGYKNIFNSNYYIQTYHQFSFSYRRKVNDQFAFGVKLNALLGILYKKVDITSSDATFDKVADNVNIGLTGTFHDSYVPDYNLTQRILLPALSNPGASISLGTTYRTEDGFLLQVNIKDLGFIHWDKQSQTFNFNQHEVITNLSSPKREDSIYNHVNSIIHDNLSTGAFNTPIDGRVELSVNRAYWINYDETFKYSPTLIASKELFYPGFTGAFVNPVQYDNYILTLTGTYDDLKTFNLGLQFMIKTPGYEFFIGSDKLMQTYSLAADAISKNASSVYQNNSFTGADFFIGFTLKFGSLIEHPMNGSQNGF